MITCKLSYCHYNCLHLQLHLENVLKHYKMFGAEFVMRCYVTKSLYVALLSKPCSVVSE